MIEPRLAEVATENYWRAEGAVLTRRALRTKYARVDLFGADVLAIFESGGKAWTQATTAQRAESIRRRRRKLELVPWADNDRVFVFEVEERPGVVRKRSVDYFFRVHEYHDDKGNYRDRAWEVREQPVPIAREWFRAKPPAQEPS